MKIVCIADTHSFHDDIDMPEGDVLIHVGDMSQRGRLEEITQFNKWLGTLDYKHIIVIAGNHDWFFEQQPYLARELMTNCTYLLDEEVIIDGLKIYGSPWQPWFCDWAFNVRRGLAIAEKWARIPDDTNILVTHGPPYPIMDLTYYGKEHVGCRDLSYRIKQLDHLNAHIYGHIHECPGMEEHSNITYVNATICTLNYVPKNKPIVIEI